MIQPTPRSTLFPYTTLFRSGNGRPDALLLHKPGASYRFTQPLRTPEQRLCEMACERVSPANGGDRKSTRLNSSHVAISYAVFCLKKKKSQQPRVGLACWWKV